VRLYLQAAREHKLRHFLKWRWNMLVHSIMRPLHIRPWWDPEYDVYLARERAEAAELIASLDTPRDEEEGR